MCDVNYKERDRKLIMGYIAAKGGEADVEDIIRESGAEKLRVYPILFEEEQAGHVKVLDRARMGAAERVKLDVSIDIL